jgi:hypothetical protein
MDTRLELAEGTLSRDGGARESPVSAVSWAAIIAGAAVAASVSLILITLGSGFGLASISPWPGSGVAVTTFTTLAAIWLIIVQWVASALGGYVTGRLRTRWVGTHTHEVYFRDTAHGFTTWALATLVSVMLFATVASALAGSAARATDTAEAQAAMPPMGYDVDQLFRVTGAPRGSESAATDSRSEAVAILSQTLRSGEIAASDRAYLAELVAARTGLTTAEARMRVDAAVMRVQAQSARDREAADQARKAAARASIFMGLAMLIGAFIACAAAALGGQLRDRYV